MSLRGRGEGGMGRETELDELEERIELERASDPCYLFAVRKRGNLKVQECPPGRRYLSSSVSLSILPSSSPKTMYHKTFPGLLTAILQTHSRLQHIPINSLAFETTVHQLPTTAEEEARVAADHAGLTPSNWIYPVSEGGGERLRG